MLISEETQNGHLLYPLFVKGQGESRAAGLDGENRVAAVLCYSSPSIQTHPAEELLQAAISIHCCGKAAGFSSGSGGTTEQLQSLLRSGAGYDRGG